MLLIVDRFHWARVIIRAQVVDLDFVSIQLGRAVSVRRAVLRYIRDGYRTGFSLNPLFLERLVSAQLPDSERVPALYAYLVSDPAKVQTTVSWDAAAYAENNPESITAPGGPLGYCWRSLRLGGSVLLGRNSNGRRVTYSDVLQAVQDALRGAPSKPAAQGETVGPALVWYLGKEDADGSTLLVLSSLLDDQTVTALCLDETAPDDLRVAAAQITLWDSRAQIRDAASRPEAAHDEGTIVLIRAAGAEVTAETARALIRGAEAGPVQALWLRPNGTIASAATTLREGRSDALFAEHPVEDVRGLGGSLPSDVLDSPVRAYRVGDASAPRTLLGFTATSEAAFSESPFPAGSDSALAELQPGRGLELSLSESAAPVITRRSIELLQLPDGTSVPRLRWAIKTAAPAGSAGEAWGDTHFARGLASALERLGQYVAVDALTAAHRATSHLDDVVLVLRGPERIRPPAAATTLQWIISHPDEITTDEIQDFDIVYAASAAWAAAASTRMGVEIRALLQCTDVHRFFPRGLPRSPDLVFVGTARGIYRPSVVEPLRAGASLRVYGPDWRGFIPASAIAGTHVPNDELPQVYESAGAVMNDHWPAMQREGFISNRLYDVVAAGGRAISDHVTGIPDIFTTAVRTYRSTSELLELVATPLDTLFPPDDELAEIRSAVRAEHSFDARAQELLRTVIRSRDTE